MYVYIYIYLYTYFLESKKYIHMTHCINDERLGAAFIAQKMIQRGGGPSWAVLSSWHR